MSGEVFESAVRAFVSHDQEMEHLRTSLSEAYTRWSNSAKILAAMVVPCDVEEGETICVWVCTGFREERLLSVKLVRMVTKTVGSRIKSPVYQVMFRGKPREIPKDGAERLTATEETNDG